LEEAQGRGPRQLGNGSIIPAASASEEDAKLAKKLGRLHPFVHVFPPRDAWASLHLSGRQDTVLARRWAEPRSSHATDSLAGRTAWAVRSTNTLAERSYEDSFCRGCLGKVSRRMKSVSMRFCVANTLCVKTSIPMLHVMATQTFFRILIFCDSQAIVPLGLLGKQMYTKLY
jgi:hypothetical protein